ncbi:uncharacterized protein GGS22DRAFT_26878 [Annulohypoxylon maeteangense]|uniref:uncharacterized protein n=1 Tax=Annulohypoxylon maeteangense TaxID=1927788 RepID=UPI002007FAF4|nr:uncharacterized protein GGS22DRAFT_26878 [Annulohypoxylon maeteangense]KAI0883864.1 hypothetical protein GGS22DRAFT_26878 [Annulohypoxylon maeteangense]
MAHTNLPGTPNPPLRILSLDGGGIRGKSSLLILENIMEGIRREKCLDQVPKPCEHFDFIGGTSTGGIIAIMLGRLGMTVDECIRSYDKVAQAAFTPKRNRLRKISGKSTFSAQALEGVTKQVVREFCTDELCVKRRSDGHSSAETCSHSNLELRHTSCTKTAVLAITKDNVDAPPTIISTYDTSAPLKGCTIWEVVRATSAATTFFKSIQLGRDNIEFIDAGFGHNNPCDILITEAQKQYPGYDQLLVLSIGTGLNGVATVRDNVFSIVKALTKMATSSNRVAERLSRRYGDGIQYFRFDVDRGLDNIPLSHWEKSSKISAHTINYLNQNQRKIKRFVDSLVHGTGTGPEILSQAIENEPNRVYFEVPFPQNKRFVGRSSILDQLEQMLFIERCSKVALVGLGGIGKTQVALQFAYWVKKNKLEYSVFWVPALSNATFEQAYGEIARKLLIQRPGEKDTRVAVRDYLSSNESGKWLLIIDNADETGLLFGRHDESTGISQYLPRSDNGLTLLTTRFGEVAQSFAENDKIELSEMGENEALGLLKRSLDRDRSHHDEPTAKELVHELSYLPLAIKQAVAYLNTKKLPIAEYLRLLRKTEKDMTSLMSKEFRDESRYSNSANAVATTWLVSFDQIREADKEATFLLEFISCLEPRAIPQSILPISQTESQLADAVGTLCAYSFLTRRDDDKTFDMHRLVHLGARIWVQRHDRTVEMLDKTMIHLEEIFPPYRDFTGRNRRLWHAYAPHALRAINHIREHNLQEKYQLLFTVSEWLINFGRYEECIGILEEVYQWGRVQLPEDERFRLNIEDILSWAYSRDMRYTEAIEMREGIMKVVEKLYPKNNKYRLRLERELADIYYRSRQYDEATEILRRIMPIYATMNDDNNRRRAEKVLASVYSRTGKNKEAIELLEEIVTRQAATLPQDDFSRLHSEHELGRLYINSGCHEEAIALLEHAVAEKQKVYSGNNSNRLASEYELGRAYLEGGRVEEAIEILEHVTTIRKALPENNSNRLASEYELGRAYLKGGRVEEAIEILEHVTEVESRVLEDGIERTVSVFLLAKAYLKDGRVEKAIKLFEHVIEVEKRILDENNASRLTSEHELGRAYLKGGRVKEAIEILEHVTEVESRVLEDGIERTVSVFLLAKAYVKDGRVEKAIKLFEHVAEVEKRTLDENDPSIIITEECLESAYAKLKENAKREPSEDHDGVNRGNRRGDV